MAGRLSQNNKIGTGHEEYGSKCIYSALIASLLFRASVGKDPKRRVLKQKVNDEKGSRKRRSNKMAGRRHEADETVERV